MIIHQMRDCDAWRKEGLEMNTTSNEASKLYDAALTQLVNWQELNEYGGLENTLENMINSDENFILGHVLKSGIELIGTSFASDNYIDYKNKFKEIIKKSKKLNLNNREIFHLEAIKNILNGNLKVACDYWEKILVEYPTDLMSLKFAQDTYFYLGYQIQMRDSIARVLPFWNRKTPLFSSLYGLHAFGLVQSNNFNEAKTAANKGLELNKNDAWATHALCHYYEYTNDFNEGIEFLRNTESNWSICDLIAPHNYWHLALCHIEKNEHEIALDIFDKFITKNINLNRTLDMVDCVSLLYRLRLDFGNESDINKKWQKLFDVYKSRIKYHGYVFNDAHVLMLLDACKNEEGKLAFFSSFNAYLNSEEDQTLLDSSNNITKSCEKSCLKNVNHKIAPSLFEAICHFNQREFSKVVDLLYPIRYDILKIGGSNAQRDLFQQILAQSALRSDSIYHNKLGLSLINERISLKPNSNLTKRLATRFAAKHELD